MTEIVCSEQSLRHGGLDRGDRVRRQDLAHPPAHQGRAWAASREDDALIGSMQSQIDRLTERVAVLEKLVTDDDRRLAREIDGLRGRDRPSV